MEFFQLVYASTLGKTCNFSKAAEKLFIAQPTLSYQIQRLEKELGFPLFNRTTKSVSLTAEGAQFLKAAEKVLQEMKSLDKMAQKLSQSFNAELILGTSSLSSIHISDGVAAFMQAFPQIQLRMVECWDPQLLELLCREELDVAVLCVEDLGHYKNRLLIHPVLEEHLCVVVGSDSQWAGKESICAEELRNERLVLDMPLSELRKAVMRLFEQCGMMPEKIIELSSLDARVALARKGMVTFAMSEQIKQHTKEKGIADLSIIPLHPIHSRTFALVTTREKGKSFVVQSFLEIAVEKAKEHFQRKEEV